MTLPPGGARRSHVDRPTRAPAPVHLRRDVDAHRHPRGRDHPPDADGHLPGHRHPGHLGRLELHRPARPRRWRSASSPTTSARSPPRSTTSSTSRASRSPASRSSRSSSSRARSIEAATAQVTAISQTVVRQMPPGTTPPFIIRYSASNVPILQVGARERHAERAAALRLRHELHPRRHRDHPRRADPVAVRRQAARRSWSTSTRSGSTRWGLSPRDVNDAIGAQNVILPTGTAKIGDRRVPRRAQLEPGAPRARSATSRSRR